MKTALLIGGHAVAHHPFFYFEITHERLASMIDRSTPLRYVFHLRYFHLVTNDYFSPRSRKIN
jgi:hypothetical protein